jgi:hypothetical protein
MEKLPIRRMRCMPDDDSFIEAVALVDMPAIEMNWQAYSNNQFKFSANEEKRIISGPLMVADLPIYRRDKSGEYYSVFFAEDIYNLRNKFFKGSIDKSVNKMHDPQQPVEGLFMVESFLIDGSRGIYSPKGYNLTDGSWFGSYKVDNDEVWNEFIKTGEFKGFSVEGYFEVVEVDAKPLTVIEQIIDIVKNIDN